MHIVYTKEIYLATDDIPINLMVEWFTHDLDYSEIIEELANSDDLTPESLVNEIFITPWWIDSFYEKFLSEENTNDMNNDEVNNQIREVLEVPLINYFNENWDWFLMMNSEDDTED
jgi:hypothetical protein